MTRPLRPVEPLQPPEVEALRRRWVRAVDRMKRFGALEHADAERAAWRAYREAAWPTDPPQP